MGWDFFVVFFDNLDDMIVMGMSNLCVLFGCVLVMGVVDMMLV